MYADNLLLRIFFCRCLAFLFPSFDKFFIQLHRSLFRILYPEPSDGIRHNRLSNELLSVHLQTPLKRHRILSDCQVRQRYRCSSPVYNYIPYNFLSFSFTSFYNKDCRFAVLIDFILTEISLEHSFEALAVSSFNI